MDNQLDISLSSDEWLKDLFDHAHDLIQIVHLDSTLIYVNKSWTTLLEYTQAEIQGKSLYTFIDERDRARYKEYRRQVIEGLISGQPIVFKLKTKSGRLISVEGVVTAKLDGGKPWYTRGIFRDITLRLQNEAQLQHLNKELQEREQNVQQLLINAPDAVVVIDKESHIRFWNPKAEAVFGWRAEEVINHPLQFVIIPAQYREAHARGMEHYLASGEGPVLNKTIEITALKKSGQEFYVSLTISPTYQNGDIAFIAFIRDITEQKHNQLELEKKTRELEQFTYVSHHDLQEPLRKIIMFAGMVKSDSYDRLSESSQKLFDKIVDAAGRMSTALKDVLNYASLNREDLLSPVDLNDVLAAVMADLELVISEKKASIRSDTLPTIRAVNVQMHQVFYNLLNNALKFAKPDVAPIVTITCRELRRPEIREHPDLDSHRQYVAIAVQDNGIGFNADASQKIFTMFQRLHSKQAYPGTGIGLALCKKVAQNHGGKIWAEGKPGVGATFTVILPLG
ncbi:PAS domain S-box protein [Nibrella viscosa]|uniref:histidine kinase n=1 Tax=Nibrella viscosa TaxID=1084524 RepID=A0ABP8L1M6_9BACT